MARGDAKVTTADQHLAAAAAIRRRGLKQLERLGRHRRQEPSLPDTGLDEEDSKVIREAVRQGVGDAIAEGLRSASVMPPPSRGSALSLRGPWGWKLGSHGKVTWLVAVLAFVLAAGALFVWATSRQVPTPVPALSPKL